MTDLVPAGKTDLYANLKKGGKRYGDHGRCANHHPVPIPCALGYSHRLGKLVNRAEARTTYRGRA